MLFRKSIIVVRQFFLQFFVSPLSDCFVMYTRVYLLVDENRTCGRIVLKTDMCRLVTLPWKLKVAVNITISKADKSVKITQIFL